jgi:flagellar biosynthesis protein FlhG
MARALYKNAEIWAIGGGKGGIGKSFIISNLANHLALTGKKVVLIDADLGGANLHTFFGVSRPRMTLTDFFEQKIPLETIISDSGVDNLGLLIGAISSLAPESIKYTQKLKLFRHIRNLHADYILIDLGAGSHFNSIDTFLLADKMIVGVVPEIIAIENLYYYLKNVFYRKLMHVLGRHGLKRLLEDTWSNRHRYNIRNLNGLIVHLKAHSGPVSRIVAREMETFNIHIILNKVRKSGDIAVGHSVKSICRKYFGFSAQYVGYIEYDEFVSRCINKRQPYMQAYPASRCTREIGDLAESLMQGHPAGEIN